MSSFSKDLAIKLFGRTIPLSDCQIPATSATCRHTPNNSDIMDACSIITKAEGEDTTAKNSGKPNKSSALWNSEKEQSIPLMNVTQLSSKSKEDQVETNSGDQEEEVFKKPDKILPCPRCNSYDTKFCYFNNYNVNQPRYYCRKCQRYWTAGGTMRNVPIGAGRRKNKHMATEYCQVMVSSNAAPTSRVENSDSASLELLACGNLPNSFRSNGPVLKVGSEAPFGESVVTVLNPRDQKRFADKGSVHCGENGEEPSSCGSSVTVSSFSELNMPEKIVQKEQGGFERFCNNLPPPHHLNCYPIPRWAFPSNVGWNNATHVTPMMAVPGFCTSSIPVQFVPASFLGCGPIWPGIIGNINMTGVNSCPSLSSSTSYGCSGNGSPILGKHSRGVDLFDDEKAGSSNVVAKTPRIDEPHEALKSRTCVPLGLKPDQTGRPESKCENFVAFEPKAESKGHVLDTTRILEANPAALSRSQTFQEIT